MLAGPVLFVAWFAAALAQPEEFSIVHHASSDLGADTANSAWISNQLGSNLPGLLLLVFAWGLWRSVGRHLSARIGSVLIAIVGVAIFTSGFLRLDCRAIDAGCKNDSWHAILHGTNSGITLLALALAPFVFARAFKVAQRWRDLWLLTLGVGIGIIAAAVVGGAVGEGLGELLPVFLWFAWIAVLALRMRRLAREVPPSGEERSPSVVVAGGRPAGQAHHGEAPPAAGSPT
jgi:hypothetical membrane protein